MTNVPACTDTQTTVESPDDCGTAQSIITESTGPANALVKGSQELIGKIIGTTHPYPQICVMDLNWHGKSEESWQIWQHQERGEAGIWKPSKGHTEL